MNEKARLYRLRKNTMMAWEARCGLQRAAMLAAILTGASPVGGNYPVATVAITGDGAGDQTVESPVVKILEGWE